MNKQELSHLQSECVLCDSELYPKSYDSSFIPHEHNKYDVVYTTYEYATLKEMPEINYDIFEMIFDEKAYLSLT